LSTNTTVTVTGSTAGKVIPFGIAWGTGTGSHTITWDATVAGGGIAATDASVTCYQAFWWDGTTATPSSTMPCPGAAPAIYTSTGKILLPPAPETVPGLATTNTFANKTIDSANNPLLLAGIRVTGVAGNSGVVPMASSLGNNTPCVATDGSGNLIPCSGGSAPDPSIILLQEWFSPNDNSGPTNGAVGYNSWTWRLNNGATNPSWTGTPLSGIAIHSSTTASSSRNVLWLGNLNTGISVIHRLDTITGWDIQSGYSVNSLTTITGGWCMGDAADYTFLHARVCVVLDTTSGVSTTNFVYRVCTSTPVCFTDVDSGVTAVANTPYRARFHSTSIGVGLLSISTNGGAYSTEVSVGSGQTINQAIPQTAVFPVYFVSNANTAVDRIVNANYFMARIPNSGR
jgi:hypothetical protein